MEKIVLNLLYKYYGNWDDVYSAISRKEEAKNENLEFIPPSEFNNFFIINENYPNKFKDIAMPPFFIFWTGNIKLLNENVLFIGNSFLPSDYEYFIKIKELKKYTLCFNIKNISKDITLNLLKQGYNIIFVYDNWNDHLDFDYSRYINNLLFIYEYWDGAKYQPSKWQTVERLIYAISDKLYLTSIDFNSLNKLLLNYEHKQKPIFCLENLKNIISKIEKNDLKISYVKNIHDIV